MAIVRPAMRGALSRAAGGEAPLYSALSSGLRDGLIILHDFKDNANKAPIFDMPVTRARIWGDELIISFGDKYYPTSGNKLKAQLSGFPSPFPNGTFEHGVDDRFLYLFPDDGYYFAEEIGEQQCLGIWSVTEDDTGEVVFEDPLPIVQFLEVEGERANLGQFLSMNDGATPALDTEAGAALLLNEHRQTILTEPGGPHDLMSNGPYGFAVAFWFREIPFSLSYPNGTAKHRGLVHLYSGTWPSVATQSLIQISHSAGNLGQVFTTLKIPGGWHSIATTQLPTVDDQWHFAGFSVAPAYGTGGTTEWKLFYDEEIIKPTPTSNWGTSFPSAIAFGSLDPADWRTFHNGYIAAAAFWNRALSDDRIHAYRNATANRAFKAL